MRAIVRPALSLCWLIAALSHGLANSCEDFDPPKFKKIAEDYIAYGRSAYSPKGLFLGQYDKAQVSISDIRRPKYGDTVGEFVAVVPIELDYGQIATLQIYRDCTFYFAFPRKF